MSETLTSADRHNAIVDGIMDIMESGELAEHLADLSGDLDALYRIVVGALVKTLPGVTGDEIVAAFRDISQRLLDKNIERKAAIDEELDLAYRIDALCEGLPEDMTIGEAVSIRAAEGNDFAQWLLRNPHVLNREITIPAEEGDE